MWPDGGVFSSASSLLGESTVGTWQHLNDLIL